MCSMVVLLVANSYILVTNANCNGMRIVRRGWQTFNKTKTGAYNEAMDPLDHTSPHKRVQYNKYGRGQVHNHGHLKLM